MFENVTLSVLCWELGQSSHELSRETKSINKLF